MKKSIKVLSIIMAVVLVFACGIGATLAYLKDSTKAVTNTFTAKGLHAGDFILTEHEVTRNALTGEYSIDSTAPTTDANSYEVVPGSTLPKDPWVEVTPSENAYVFIEVVGMPLPTGMDAAISNKWSKINTDQKPHGGDIYKLASGQLKAEQKFTQSILDGNKITVKPDFTAGAGTENTLTFYAYLTQSTNMDDAENAWKIVGPEFVAAAK